MAHMQQSIYNGSQIFPRVEELDHELDLPPYTHPTVLLDLDYYTAKTYNMMQMVIAVNAVDSERTGLVCITVISSTHPEQPHTYFFCVSRITCLAFQ